MSEKKSTILVADDYLTKPFNVNELLARVRAVLRRAHFSTHELSQALPTTTMTTTIGALTIDSRNIL